MTSTWLVLGACVLGLVVCLFGIQADANAYAQKPHPIELYRERPACDNARALDLPSSIKTPFKSGLTVWICD